MTDFDFNVLDLPTNAAVAVGEATTRKAVGALIDQLSDLAAFFDGVDATRMIARAVLAQTNLELMPAERAHWEAIATGVET